MISAVHFQRVGNWFYKKKVPLIPKMIDYLIRLVFACWFPHSVNVGKNLILGYGGLAIVIHGNVKIGDNVHIDQCVTIGGNGRVLGVPIIGSKVYIGSGAKILGPIKVGDGSVIAANAVVINDIPPYSVVAGVPCRVVKREIEIDSYIIR